MRMRYAAAAIVMLFACQASAADQIFSDVGNAAKDAATQSAKERAQQKLGTGTTQMILAPQSTTDGAKDAAKNKAKETTNSALDRVFGK